MAIQLTIQYRSKPLTFDVTTQDNSVYLLRLQSKGEASNNEYIPEKIVIRRKRKTWISDMDNYDELINALTNEIIQFNSQT